MTAAASAPSPLSPHTQVLIIEDEPVIGALVKATLEEAGFSVMVLAPMSPDLLRIAVERLRPACILLDGSNHADYGQSWGDAAWLRAREQPVPVLMFSSDCNALTEAWIGTSERSRAAAFAGIVEQPFDLDVLEAAVAGVVNCASDAAGVVHHFRAQDLLN